MTPFGVNILFRAHVRPGVRFSLDAANRCNAFGVVKEWVNSSGSRVTKFVNAVLLV